MRGLIEKDLRLLFKRKQIFAVIIFVEIMLGISGSGNFAVVYFTMLAGIIAAGTLSYDEFDNGLEFLFTLPIDRKTYIRGKYVLCAAFCAVAWLISIGLYAITEMISGHNADIIAELPLLFIILPSMSMMSTVILPLQLKFGSEKGKVALFVICGCLAAAIVLIKNMFFDTEEAMLSLVYGLQGISMGAVILGFTAVCILVVLITYSLSVKIMQNKEL
ncbi:MAG: ABC-2 transporter permease [Butyrivibrio sp.]|nr:ABC-2 transporter permease [Butyrivibrio sp.]